MVQKGEKSTNFQDSQAGTPQHYFALRRAHFFSKFALTKGIRARARFNKQTLIKEKAT